METRTWVRRHGDRLLAGALALAITLEILVWSAGRDVDVPLLVAAGLLSTLPLLVRRRSPALTFVLAMVGLQVLMIEATGFDNDSLALVITFFVALYSLGRHAAGAEAWVGAGLLLLEALLFLQGDVGLSHADPGDVAFTVGFLGAPWGTGLTLRLRRDREELLHAENDRLRTEQSEREARAIAEERSRIARELHDVVSHAIAVTVLQARGARRSLESDPEAVRTALDAIEQTTIAALGDMRRLLAVLRDTESADLDADRAPQPSLGNLDRLLERVRDSGVPVEVAVVGRVVDLPPGVDLSAYRIVQEALTNVIKHAPGARVTLRVEYGADALCVVVTDDGGPVAVGVGADAVGGHGLIGIRERVAVVGGEVAAGPLPEGGYRLRARLPYSLETS